MRKIEQQLVELKIDSASYPNFTRLNIYILKDIFYEFFIFEGFTRLIESNVPLNYEQLIKQARATEETASSLIMKVAAWLELQKRAKEGLRLLERMLQFYMQNEQRQKAFLLILFILNYTNKNSLAEVNQEQYNHMLDDLLYVMKEKEAVLSQLTNITKEKYEKLVAMIETFDVQSDFSRREMKLLKAIFLEGFDKPDRLRFQNMSDLRFYCYIFNEEEYFNNLSKMDTRMKRVKYTHNPRVFFDRLRILASRFKRFNTFAGSFYVLKFNSRSKGYKFRYLRVSRSYIAVVDEKHRDKIYSDYSQRGVCKLTR